MDCNTYAANFFFVKKKDGKLRPVQDYRPLNKWTIRNQNVSPLIPQVIDRLSGCTLFTKFDVRWGYNNIRIREGDEWKAAFLTPEGLFEPVVMFFGLTNSPATFQTMVNMMFRPLVRLKVFSIYMDDGCIHTAQLPGETHEQHLARHRKYVHEAFDILEKYDLYLKPEKCAFEQTEIEFLGVTVGNGKIQMDPSKVQAIKNWSTPKNPTDVRAFLGFTGYYRYFIEKYSLLARPLLDLTKKSVEWHWGKPQEDAFQTLKLKMCNKPVLMQPDFNKRFYLQTDASGYSMGAILSQEGEQPSKSTTPKLHPIAYYSATFTSAERNYDIYERELLAVMKSLAHWRPYLGWTKTPFIIRTDHANLQYWKSPQNLNRRTARWHADLQEYDFILEHIPGKTNVPSDFLSRPPHANQGKKDNQGVIMIPPEKCRTMVETNKIQVPPILEVKRGIMRLYHNHPLAGHPGRDETIRKVQERYSWPHMTQWIGDYVKGCATCQQNKILTHKAKIPLFRIPTMANARPFQRVAMDLITGLPKKGDKDAILTIVDQGCSRAAVFLPCSTTITGPQIAQLYLDHVYKWFGLPDKIISDQDPCFTSHFGKALTKRLNIEQNLSSAFHPQTDGLSERKNQWIEQYLRIITSLHPEDWTNWISIATVVHNNRRNATIGLSPNQVLLGYEPTLTPGITTTTTNQSTEERIKLMLQRRQEAIQALNKAAQNSAEIPVRFHPGDQVWLEATNLRLPFQASKLNPKRYGPFKVLRVLSPVAYQLELPNNWRVHNTFHSSLLSPYHETLAYGPNFSRPPPDLIDNEEEQEIEHILGHRYFGTKRHLQYLIKWKGFPESENKWVSPTHMHAPDLIRQYNRRNPHIAIRRGTTTARRNIPHPSTPVPQVTTCPTSPQTPPLPRSLRARVVQSTSRPLHLHPRHRFLSHLHAQIPYSMPTGSRVLSPLAQPLLPWNSTPPRITRSVLTSPKDWQKPSKSGTKSIKNRKNTSWSFASGSPTSKTTSTCHRMDSSRICTTISPSPTATTAFYAPSGSSSSMEEGLRCFLHPLVPPTPLPLPASTPPPTLIPQAQLSPCLPGSVTFSLDPRRLTKPPIVPSSIPNTGGSALTWLDSEVPTTTWLEPTPASKPLKPKSTSFKSRAPSRKHDSKSQEPPRSTPTSKRWRWGAMSPFLVGPGRRKHSRLIGDDLPRGGGNVTGTWSRQWGKDKFGNRAIEVRDFSGESTGLGSGAAPPGMSV